jgi:hypothetical protein
MLPSDLPRATPMSRLLHWMLVVLAVLFITLPANPFGSLCACHEGAGESVVMCELDDPERLPVHGAIMAIATPEPKPTFADPPIGPLSDPCLDPASPPPRAG